MRGLVALIVILGFSGSTVGAQQSPCAGGQITITNTGPDSTNVVDCVTVSDVKVTCNNSIYVLTSNSQTAISGKAGSNVNTSAGSAISGNATNTNGDTVQIGATCVTEATTPATPVTPVTPTAVTPTTGTGAAKPKVAVLPNTASNSVTETAVIGLLVLVSILVLSRLAVTAYRYTALK